MAALDITKTVIKPSLSVAVEFSAAAPAPTQYTVTADDGVNDPITVSGTKTVLSLPPLLYGTVYTLTVTAEYPEPTADVVGAESELTVTKKATPATILRQRILDLLSVAGLMMEERPLQFFQDDYGRPTLFKKGDAVSRKAPILEIQMPTLKGQETASRVRRREHYECKMRLLEASNDENTALGQLDLLFNELKNYLDAEVDGLPRLAMPGIGGHSVTWTWTQDDEPIVDDGVVGLEFSITVPFEIMIGKLPFA